MKVRLVLIASFLLGLAGVTPLASAQNDEDLLVRNADGRLRGYAESGVVIDAGDTPVYAYFAFAGLALVATIVFFKDARRTHLD